MTYVDAIGFAGATLTTIAFVPQVLKAWRSKSTRDISLAMFLMIFVGIICWLTYGLLTGDGPLIAANVVSLVLASAILAMKFRYK
jgi:MtN3 and saliva related transmembrane protein